MGQTVSVDRRGYFNLDVDNKKINDTLYVYLDNEDYTKDITHDIRHIVFEIPKIQPYRLPQHIKSVKFKHKDFNQSIDWVGDYVEHITIGTLDKKLYKKIFEQYLDSDEDSKDELESDYYDFLYDCKYDCVIKNSGSQFNQNITNLPSQLISLKIYNDLYNKDIAIKTISDKIKYIIKGSFLKLNVYDRNKNQIYTYV